MVLKATNLSYRELEADISRRIMGGELAPGDRLCGIREGARQYSSSVAVVRRAFDELERKGMIVRRHGSGTFVNPLVRRPDSCLVALISSYKRNDIESYYEPLFEEAGKARVVPMVAVVDHHDNWRQGIGDVMSRNPDLLLIDLAAKGFPLEEVRKLAGNIPVCFCNRWEWHPELPDSGVFVDYRRAYAEGLRLLLERGHRRIVLLMHHRQSLLHVKANLGYGLEMNGLGWDSPEIILLSREQIDTEPDRVRSIVRERRPDAVFGVSDHIVSLLTELCPWLEDLDTIGFFNTGHSRMRGHEFSSFEIDFGAIWEKAFRTRGRNLELVCPVLVERHRTLQAQAV